MLKQNHAPDSLKLPSFWDQRRLFVSVYKHMSATLLSVAFTMCGANALVSLSVFKITKPRCLELREET